MKKSSRVYPVSIHNLNNCKCTFISVYIKKGEENLSLMTSPTNIKRTYSPRQGTFNTMESRSAAVTSKSSDLK